MNAMASTARPVPMLTVAYIQQVVADHYALPVEVMRSKRRYARVARPRQVAMYLSSILLPMRSLPSLGRAFQRDHTTVMHAINRVGERMNKSAEFRAEVAELQRHLIETATPDPLRESADRLAEDTADALREALKARADADPAGFIASVCDLAGMFKDASP